MPVDALIYRDANIEATTPGIHALIVGVSDYLYLTELGDPPRDESWFMSKLTSPALSAFAFYQRLMRNDLRLPVKTVRLLLSPSEKERENDELAIISTPAPDRDTVPRANRDAFEKAARAWREDAAKNSEDMIILFFSGHGVQRVVDQGIILLDDFLADERALRNAATIENLRAGLTPSTRFPDIALTQFFFIDSCLLQPVSMMRFVDPEVPQIFGPLFGGPADRRESAVMFSTVDRAMAIARDGQTSHFTEGLLHALDHGAEDRLADDPDVYYWPVTADTLKTAINLYYAKAKVGTSVKMEHNVGQPVIRRLSSPPDVDVAVLIKPETLSCSIKFVNERDVPAGLPPYQTTSFNVRIAAGFYRMQIASNHLAQNPFHSSLEWINQKKSQIPWSCDLARSLI